ncbi:MAG: class I SAM-dependent methyltransferase [Rhizomicrobium sp.]
MGTPQAEQPVASTLDLDELMERIRAEVAERKAQSGIPAVAAETPLAAPDPDGRIWTAQALLALPVAEFARAVHLAFYGREPTPEEFVNLRDRLLTGRAGRMRVLREFWKSREAREGRRTIAGFWRASVWDRIYWSPPAKSARSLGRGIANIWNARRHVRDYIARLENVERRTAEGASATRALQSAELAHVRQLKEQIAATRQASAVRAGNIENSMAELAAQLTHHWRTILDQKLRTESFLSAGASSLAGGGAIPARAIHEKTHLLDPLYLSFEDRYRGTRTLIKERQRIYLPHIEACLAEAGDGSVIDIGCGRGEWLELLSESGIPAQGCDLNRIAVEESRERGLDVREADALDVLSSLPDNCSAAITSFHVIEHIGLETLVSLLDQTLRVLKPGGMILLETPNPANLIVAAEKFYFDPTHRNPIPSELIGYLLKARGFCGIDIVPLHPVEWEARRSYADPMLALLQDKLFGPQDYAAIGRKPA